MTQPRSDDAVLGGARKSTIGALVLGFVPSDYQRDIFRWIQTGNGSCVVAAVPGSGKTTTLIRGLDYVQNRSSMFLAFNKHIVKYLQSKLPLGVKVSTLHSLGLASLYRHLPSCEIENNKYRDLIADYLKQKNIKSKFYYKLYYKNLVELVRFCQLTLTNPAQKEDLKKLSKDYNLNTYTDWDFYTQGTSSILTKGIAVAREQISFDDMVWLPHIFGLSLRSADFICVDEAQDLNAAQLELALKAHKQGARALYVGDRHQAIMGFAAADYRSMDTIIKRTRAITKPLSICYRCPLSHIEKANSVYDVIKPSPQAQDGEIINIDKKQIASYAHSGDLVICRCNYPLFGVYYQILEAGKAAFIKNKNVFKQLLSLVEDIFLEVPSEFTAPQFRGVLIDWYLQQKQAMLANDASPMTVMIIHDLVNTLFSICKGHNCQSLEAIVKAIKSLQAKNQPRDSVMLTTIHGAKGLEAKRVFFLQPRLVPHHAATTDSELEQERNLLFVAYTRSKQQIYLAE